MTTLTPGRTFHLAFILPMMSTWFFQPNRAQKVFLLVLLGLCTHFLFLAALYLVQPVLSQSFPWLVDTKDMLDFIRFENVVQLFSNLVFWGVLGVIFVLLRHLQGNALDELDRAEKIRLAFETITAKKGEVVFAKNKARQFFFANKVLLEKFAPFAGEETEIDPVTGRKCARWQFLGGKTDEEINLPYHQDYEESDETTFETGEFANNEPDFSEGSAAGEAIWTEKVRIGKSKEDAIGLVGCVQGGWPHEIQVMSEYLTSHFHIYATMKDDQGRILWANARHLNRLEKKIEDLFERRAEQVIKRQLEGIKLNLHNAVFAKNARRQYIFANEQMLALLQEEIQAPGSAAGTRGKTLKEMDVLGRTDEELFEKFGLNNKDEELRGKLELYRRDDEDILTRREKTIERTSARGVCTYKAPIKNHDDKIIGLVAVVVPADQQAQITKIKDYVINRLKPLTYCTLAGKLKALQLKDTDIYEDLGDGYEAMDSEIMRKARQFSGETDDFNQQMPAIINTFHPRIVKEKLNDYPANGWREEHRFPGDKAARQVEVWKMPWWGDRLSDNTTKVKGILVFFRDIP